MRMTLALGALVVLGCQERDPLRWVDCEEEPESEFCAETDSDSDVPQDTAADDTGDTGHTETDTSDTGAAAEIVLTLPTVNPTPLFNDSTARCASEATAPDGSSVVVSYAWSNETTRVGLGTLPEVALSPAAASPGDTLRCTATASHGSLTATELAEAQVVNRPPEVTEPTLDPPEVFNDGTLSCTAVASDPDGTTPTLTYGWSNETQGMSLGTDASVTLTPTMARPGDVVRCTATASDGSLETSAYGELAVGNRAPTVTTPTLSPSSGVVNTSTLTCSATAADPDGTTPSVTYAWRNETRSASLGSGASITLSPATASPGNTVRCTATASDGALTASASVDGTVEGGLGGSLDPGTALANPRLGTLRYVPAGDFTMGCVDPRDVAGNLSSCSRDQEGPSRVVALTRSIWVMESELTQGMWTTGLGFTNNPSNFSTNGTDRPVERVTWWEALEAANEASRRDGLAECYTLTGCNSNAVGANRSCTGVTVTSTSGHPKDCAGWRLPTEAEWEYAARAGESVPFSGGSSVNQVAWYVGNSDSQTQEVCTTPTPRNAWGLCDMSGNVEEWVWDRFADDYTDAATLDPVGPLSGRSRGMRGGRWNNAVTNTRVAHRVPGSPTGRSGSLGFRLVRSVP